jgi:hypothetical protein
MYSADLTQAEALACGRMCPASRAPRWTSCSTSGSCCWTRCAPGARMPLAGAGEAARGLAARAAKAQQRDRRTPERPPDRAARRLLPFYFAPWPLRRWPKSLATIRCASGPCELRPCRCRPCPPEAPQLAAGRHGSRRTRAGRFTLRNIVPAPFLAAHPGGRRHGAVLRHAEPADYYIDLLGLPDHTRDGHALPVPARAAGVRVVPHVHPRDDRASSLDALVGAMARSSAQPATTSRFSAALTTWTWRWRTAAALGPTSRSGCRRARWTSQPPGLPAAV